VTSISVSLSLGWAAELVLQHAEAGGIECVRLCGSIVRGRKGETYEGSSLASCVDDEVSCPAGDGELLLGVVLAWT